MDNNISKKKEQAARRDARTLKRSLLREDSEASKKTKMDLVEMLSSSAKVVDIISSASGSSKMEVESVPVGEVSPGEASSSNLHCFQEEPDPLFQESAAVLNININITGAIEESVAASPGSGEELPAPLVATPYTSTSFWRPWEDLLPENSKKESSLAPGLRRDLPAPLLASPSTSFWTLDSGLWRPWQLEDVKAVPAPEENAVTKQASQADERQR